MEKFQAGPPRGSGSEHSLKSAKRPRVEKDIHVHHHHLNSFEDDDDDSYDSDDEDDFDSDDSQD